MNVKFRNGLVNMGLVVMSVVVILIISEVCLGLFLPQPRYGWPQGLFMNDDELDFELTPNFTGIFEGTEFKSHTDINSKGLRDVEHTYKKSNGVFRILGLGDSFTFGLGVEFNESCLSVLEKRLNAGNKSKNYEIIKAGVPGYGTDNELAYLKTKGIKYDPNLIIMLYYLNDIYNNVGVSDRTTMNGYLVMAKWNNQEMNPQQKILAYLRIHSHSYNLFMRAQSNSRLHKYVHSFGKTIGMASNSYRNASNINIYNISESEWDFAQSIIWLYYNNYPSSFDDGYNLTKKLLKNVGTISSEHDAETLIVIIPSKEQVYPNYWNKAVKQWDINPDDYNLSKPSDILLEFGKENGIIVLDLLPEFRKHAEKGEQLYFHNNDHWNSNGHKLAAELVYIKLIEEQLIPLGGEE